MERSYIFNGSKERCNRQNYFCQVVVMKEESGVHFPLPIRIVEIREPINSFAKKIHTKSPEDAYLSF